MMQGSTGWGRPVPLRTWIVLALVAVGAFLVAAFAPDGDWVRYVVAFVLAVEVAYLAWLAPRQAILVVFGWLVVLGTARRLVSWFAVDLARDPLLLVGPVGLATLTVQSWRAGAFRRWSVLSALVAALSVVALVAVVNPRQGSLGAGLEGLLFWLVPMLGFWVGRAFGDRRVVRAAFWLFAGAAVVSAIYGFAQDGVGFPPWDDQWIRDHGYIALFVGDPKIGGARPFGFASSAVEYSLTIGFGLLLLVLFLAVAIRRRDPVVSIVLSLCAALCAIALVASGVRTTIVTLFAAFIAITVVRLRPRATVLLALLLVLVASYGALWVVHAESWSYNGTAGQVRRVVLGLRNPFDSEHSTLVDHVRIVGRGFERAWDEPLGMGTGTTHIGDGPQAKFVQDTEFDVSNAAVAFGIVGVAVSGAVLLWGFGLAAARAWRRPDLVHLATFGFLILCFRFWWNGGHYALAPLLWFLLGWLDVAGPRPRGRSRARVASHSSASS